MLDRYIESLASSIQWAQHEDEMDVLCLARERMDQVMSFIGGLSFNEQQEAYKKVDTLLPMEWPLWMEACRYQDSGNSPSSAQRVLH